MYYYNSLVNLICRDAGLLGLYSDQEACCSAHAQLWIFPRELIFHRKPAAFGNLAGLILNADMFKKGLHGIGGDRRKFGGASAVGYFGVCSLTLGGRVAWIVRLVNCRTRSVDS